MTRPSRPRPPGSGWSERWVAFAVVAGLAAGGVAYAVGRPGAADLLWAATILVALLPLAWGAVRQLLSGRTGVDAIALLAMAVSLALGELLAGAVVALMMAGGEWLESLADRRARSELAHLVERQPRSVELYEAGEDGGERLVTRSVESIAPGDSFLVRPGEVVAVDGAVEGERAVLDTSALTGEARPQVLEPGETAPSGTVNAGGPMRLRAVTTVHESTYAGIVRLVEQAQATKAPLVRLADRYAGFFLPVTLAVAGAAWALSGDPVRALAVLVVATPCPLILATPIALMGGISRAAARGVVVKGGGALEVMARADRLLLDKTGTVTRGRPELLEIVVLGTLPADELLRLAASVDLVSPHVLAAAIVATARARGLEPEFPRETREEHGDGIEGTVGGRRVRVGQGAWVRAGSSDRALTPAGSALAADVERRTAEEGLSTAWVSVDGEPAGALLFHDPLRIEAGETIDRLRALGFRNVTLVTGDHAELAERVAARLGIDRVLSGRSPADKVAAVREEARRGRVVMVGDGLNDAAALAAADVGIAMSARGASASSEAADAVVVSDNFDRVADAVVIARRSRGIAVQSIRAGMALSGVAMAFAAFGYLTPVVGALVQEAIDVAAILNALRALRAPSAVRARETAPRAVESGEGRLPS